MLPENVVGEPDAGNPHVRFDEGVQETCRKATRLCSTLRRGRGLVPLLARTMRVKSTEPARRGG